MKGSTVLMSCFLTLFVPAIAIAEIFQPLEEIAVYPERSAPATVLSLNDSILSSQISAKVQRIDVRVSQQVKKGQRLMRLECEDYSLQQQSAVAALASATAQQALAQSQLARADQLQEKLLISQQQHDARRTESLAADAAVQQAHVAVKQAELTLSRCDIVAPFSGVVTQRMVSLGQLASLGTPLLGLVDHRALEVSAQVSYADASRFNHVQQFWFEADQKVALRLHNLGHVVDPSTRSREVRLEFVDDDLLPGTSGRLLWRDPRAFIPANYVVNRGGQLGVFINQDNMAEFIALPHAAPGRDVETGLALDTLIVTQNLSQIQAGQTL